MNVLNLSNIYVLYSDISRRLPLSMLCVLECTELHSCLLSDFIWDNRLLLLMLLFFRVFCLRVALFIWFFEGFDLMTLRGVPSVIIDIFILCKKMKFKIKLRTFDLELILNDSQKGGERTNCLRVGLLSRVLIFNGLFHPLNKQVNFFHISLPLLSIERVCQLKQTKNK